MSDEQQDKPGSSGSGMTSRLASLRASIRASKAAKDEAETTEQDAANRPVASSPTAISSSQSIPIVEQPDLDDDEDDDIDDFVADDTQMMSSDELEAQDDPDEEPPQRPFRDTGEKFDTGDLHRVRPSSEDPLLEESSGVMAQMDQVSDAAEDEETSGYADPTIIQHIDDFAFVQGTPLYMSPEQCRNDKVQSATDVYSLGVMMFELLEGFPPYVAETVEEVLLMHQDAPIPEQRSQFTPPEVRDLITRMLAKDPADRPGVPEVIAVLQEHAAIGGHALGLEEESWSVAEIEESEPAEAPMVAPYQVVHHGEDFTIDAEPADQKLPPIWIVAVIGVLLLLGTIGVVAMSLGEGDEGDVPDEPVVVATPDPDPDPDPEPEPEAEPVDEIPETEPDEPVEAMEFGAAEVDAGTPSADAGSEADAGPSKEPEVKEAPKPKKKKKRRKRRKRRKKKPKKEELRELRLEL